MNEWTGQKRHSDNPGGQLSPGIKTWEGCNWGVRRDSRIALPWEFSRNKVGNKISRGLFGVFGHKSYHGYFSTGFDSDMY